MTSIIIALYNGEKYIKKTIKSILVQNADVEIIVVDDCSKDLSTKIVEQMMLKDSRIKLYYNLNNYGFCKTVNEGIKRATGQYIIVLGQDDILDANHIEIMSSKFDDDTVMVFCDYDLIDESGVLFDSSDHCIHRDLAWTDFYKNNCLPSPGLMIRRESLVKVGYYFESIEYKNYGEYHTWIRLSLIGKIVFCGDVRAKYRRHKTNISNTFANEDIRQKLLKYGIICKKQFLLSDKVSKVDKCKIKLRIAREKILCFLIQKNKLYDLILCIKKKQKIVLLKIRNRKIIKEHKLNISFESLIAFQNVYFYDKGGYYKIGKNVQFGYPIGGRFKNGYCELQARTPNSIIEIGNNTAINNNFMAISSERITIGKNCRLGINCEMMDFDARSIDPGMRSQVGKIAQIIIEDNVWIGNNVTILSGCTVGKNSVIAAGAVVTRSIPADCVAGGVPARIIKEIKENNHDNV